MFFSLFKLNKWFWQCFSSTADWIYMEAKAIADFQIVSTELYSQW